MARTKKQETKTEKQERVAVTRAEKKDATKNLIKEVLSIQPLKHNDLLDEVAKLYSQRFGADTDNPNDVKGRVGSVLDIMKKESEVANEGGMYALKARLPMPAPVENLVEKTEEKPVKKATKKSAIKAEKAEKVEKVEETAEVKTEEKPVKKAVKKTVKKEEVKVEAPTLPVEEKAEEKPAKKATKKTPKKAETPVETPVEAPVEVKEEIQPEIKAEIKAEPKVEPKAEVMDMSFLFGTVKPAKNEPKEEQTPEETAPQKAEEKREKPVIKTEEKSAQPAPKKEEKIEAKAEQNSVRKPQNQTPKKPQTAPQNQAQSRVLKTVKTAVQKPMSAEEKLRDNFLKKLRSLGGDYFEYYSVYLLEKYSRKNGRRLESLKISGGDRDGGIDGEIELTDKLGFRETIYIQSKNWDPDRGNERLWVVGETLLQQFIGACACKQAKDGKQHTRGIFITTSNFTPDAKRILDTMSDKVVGYDGDDLFEAAKECQFGIIYENGNWKLDEKLLSGTKAFFNM